MSQKKHHHTPPRLYAIVVANRPLIIHGTSDTMSPSFVHALVAVCRACHTSFCVFPCCSPFQNHVVYCVFYFVISAVARLV